MKRIFATIAILLTGLNTQAFALAGGPFDNGMQSASLDRNAIYQAILTFPNGSGYVYFQPTANIAANGVTAGYATSVGTLNVADTRGSNTTRSVLYYKGLTYVGGCFGAADYEAKSITATLNASTNAQQSQLTNQTQSNNTSFFGGSTGAAANANAISTTIISNSFSFFCNGEFNAKIYQTAPTMRFSGTGELSFLAPNQNDAKAGLAYTGFSGLVNSIITAVGNANVGAFFDATVFTQAQQAIQSAVNALPPLTSIDQAFAAGQIVKMTVSGTRRYF